MVRIRRNEGCRDFSPAREAVHSCCGGAVSPMAFNVLVRSGDRISNFSQGLRIVQLRAPNFVSPNDCRVEGNLRSWRAWSLRAILFLAQLDRLIGREIPPLKFRLPFTFVCSCRASDIGGIPRAQIKSQVIALQGSAQLCVVVLLRSLSTRRN